jgi:catechol 2,3-dioxygenase-like lactoylglutathione lyase family enzyme
MTKFAHTIICSKDLEKAKRFYCDCLGVKLSKDFGNCFTVDGDSLTIHDIVSFQKNIFRNENCIPELKNNNINIYFETDTLKETYNNVIEYGYTLIHGIEMQPWNQEVFRVFDPDGYIVEVGTPLWMQCTE